MAKAGPSAPPSFPGSFERRGTRNHNLHYARISFMHLRYRNVAGALSVAIALGLMGSTRLPAQTTLPSGNAAPVASLALSGIAHIAIRVKNVAASSDFYHKLGFDQPFTIKNADNVTVTVIKVNDRQFIEFYPPDTGPPGVVHLCFEVKDLNALHDAYVSEGLAPAAVRTSGAGNLLFTVPGPASAPLTIEYTQYMASSQHSKDFGQHLSPDRVGDKLTVVALAVQDAPGARQFYLEKLGFRPSATNPARLDLPGDSGESIEVVPAASLGTRASILLTTSDIDKAAAQLTRQQVAFQRAASSTTDAAGRAHTIEMLSVTDPDGNIIRVVETR